MSSLREQRRLRTTNTIRKAAVDLAYAHGLDAVTIDMISAKAGISPRTFFNYFPFREAALVPPDIEFSPQQIERFSAAKGTLEEDLLTLLAPIMEALGNDRETLRKSHELSQTAPKLLALSNSIFIKFDNAIAQVLAQRMRTNPESPDMLHLAALVTATIKCGFGIWVVTGQGSAESNLRARLAAIPQLVCHLSD